LEVGDATAVAKRLSKQDDDSDDGGQLDHLVIGPARQHAVGGAVIHGAGCGPDRVDPPQQGRLARGG